MPWFRFHKDLLSSLQGIHYGQALGGRTTRVKVFAEDSEFRSFPFGGPQGQDFGSRPFGSLRSPRRVTSSDAAITPQIVKELLPQEAVLPGYPWRLASRGWSQKEGRHRKLTVVLL